MDSCFLPQGIFPTQGWNPGLLHGRQILYQLSQQAWERRSRFHLGIPLSGPEREGMMADPKLQVALLSLYPATHSGDRAPTGTQEAGRWADGLEVHLEFQRQEHQMIDVILCSQGLHSLMLCSVQHMLFINLCGWKPPMKDIFKKHSETTEEGKASRTCQCWLSL